MGRTITKLCKFVTAGTRTSLTGDLCKSRLNQRSAEHCSASFVRLSRSSEQFERVRGFDGSRNAAHCYKNWKMILYTKLAGTDM